MGSRGKGLFTPTVILVTLNVLVYVCTSVVGGSLWKTNPLIMATYGQSNSLVMRGWYWQLFSSLFIHADMVHLFGNMLFLGIFGLRTEELFDQAIYLTIYFASGLFGNLLSLLLGPFAISVGASGAIFGLFGACTAYVGASLGRFATSTLIYGLYLLVLSGGPGVNILAHLGGLVAGILIGYALHSQDQP